MMTRKDAPDFEWHIVHGADDGARDVCPVSADACYCDRQPYGEYILFAASDPDALEGDRISISDYGYLAEVRVTFEEDLVAGGVADINWCHDDFAEQGEGFLSEVWPSWQTATLEEIASSIFPSGEDYVMAKSVLHVGEDEASWVDLTRIEAEQPAEMALTYSRQEKNRLLEIKAVLKDDQIPVVVLETMWRQLVERFKGLPYAQLVGARRIEQEEEQEEALDLDTLGSVEGEA
ncbi:hypothetical protein [uncultured Cohaesibacter sp.]|uniref:hypothetical protein n=1 Tax=uncultured Cohaesibacter sp. TaxID=1002546 RepID=UPI00292E3529|nr:hypothetical protein [uncultured Cohaesibacter sp.]